MGEQVYEAFFLGDVIMDKFNPQIVSGKIAVEIYSVEFGGRGPAELIVTRYRLNYPACVFNKVGDNLNGTDPPIKMKFERVGAGECIDAGVGNKYGVKFWPELHPGLYFQAITGVF